MESAKAVVLMDNSQKVQNLNPDCPETPFSYTQFGRRPLRSRTSDALIGLLSHFRTNLNQLLQQEGVEEGDGCDVGLRPVSQGKKSIIHNKSNSGALHSEKDPNCKLVHQAYVVENEENKGLHDVGFDSENATATVLDHINRARDGEPFVCENQTSGWGTEIAKEKENVQDVIGIKMDECSTFQELPVNNEICINDLSKVLDSFLDMDMAPEFSKEVEEGQDKNSVAENILTEVEHELQLKEVELEKLIYNSSGLESSWHPNADEETEEGEIAEEFGDANASFDSIYEDTFLIKEKVEHSSMDFGNEEQNICMHPDTDCRQHEIPGTSIYKPAVVGSNCVTVESRTSATEQNKSNDSLKSSSKTLNNTQISTHMAPCFESITPSGKILVERATANPYLATIEEEDDISKKKRKRGPLTKEKRAKKKKKERIKRAENNRKLGVKRLKLQPVLKPKMKEHCRHYLKGRCHEGDKCNFSHDIVPLTKAKPCGHFARNSCMKGDDCPYDHQLSKYPCNNYASTGFCSRGSNCSFSHEIPAQQISDITPNISAPKLSPALYTVPERGVSFTVSKVIKPDVKIPLLLNNPGSSKEINNHSVFDQKMVIESSYTGNSHCSSAEPAAAKTRLGISGKIPKGVSFLFNKETSIGVTSKLEQDGSSVKPSDSYDSGSINKLNEIPKKVALAGRVPRGVNFLSFTQPSDDEWSTKVFPDFLTKGDHGKGKTVLDDRGKGKVTSALSESGSMATVEMHNHCASNLNVKAIGTPLTSTNHVNFMALDRTGLDDSNDRSNFKDGSTLSFTNEGQGSQRTLLPSISMPSTSFGASSDQSAGGRSANLLSSSKNSRWSNTPIPVQNSISSTLSFAAKLEANIKMRASPHHLRS